MALGHLAGLLRNDLQLILLVLTDVVGVHSNVVLLLSLLRRVAKEAKGRDMHLDVCMHAYALAACIAEESKIHQIKIHHD